MILIDKKKISKSSKSIDNIENKNNADQFLTDNSNINILSQSKNDKKSDKDINLICNYLNSNDKKSLSKSNSKPKTIDKEITQKNIDNNQILLEEENLFSAFDNFNEI